MFLEIKGIGKILDSKIELQGITVIAGENNSGKSTFGKILYCMFNAFSNADEKVYNARANDIRRIFRNGLPRFPNRLLEKDIIEDILTNHDLRETVNEVIKKYSSIYHTPNSNIVDALFENLNRSIAIDKHEILKIIITRLFRQEFSVQVNHINRPDTLGDVSLEIKGKKIEACIKANECTSFEDNVGLLHKAIYIDTPFIMDDAGKFFTEEFLNFYDGVTHRGDLLRRLVGNKSTSEVLEEVIIKQKINNLLSNIHRVIDGEFKEDDNGLFFAEQGLKKPLPLSSVSTGIKMFLVIKRLLELGEVQEKDVLIFDEPEIHLHPSWQLHFAEILVLLQKEFNLTILLTTHSPYFLRAIEIYARKHNIENTVNFYLAESKDDVSFVTDVTKNIEAVYKQLAEPFQKLEDVRYES